MNTGNRVRLLKGTEEGIISRIIDDKLIEVEIEDGFNIPVLKNEVVVISKEEESVFGKKAPAHHPPKNPTKACHNGQRHLSCAGTHQRQAAFSAFYQ